MCPTFLPSEASIKISGNAKKTKTKQNKKYFEVYIKKNCPVCASTALQTHKCRKPTCLPICHDLSAIMAMKTSVALVTSSSPSFEMFPTPGSSRTVLRTRASGRTRLVGPPGTAAADPLFSGFPKSSSACCGREGGGLTRVYFSSSHL